MSVIRGNKMLSDIVNLSGSFTKSTNVERDSGRIDFDSYVITGRVLDLLSIIANAMTESRTGRAVSITGPYGVGKSSFALLLKALLSPRESEGFRAAMSALSKSDKSFSAQWDRSRTLFGLDARHGVLAFGTAEPEPVHSTILRIVSAHLDEPQSKDFEEETTTRGIKNSVARLTEKSPVVVLIDEFGKNLEQIGDSGSADLYLLQELAEMASGDDSPPLLLITMQHASFDAYADGVSDSQKREWSKVQGRFHDFSFIESAEQIRGLATRAFGDIASEVAATANERIAQVGVPYLQSGVIADLEQAQACFPLHPVTLAALPELCNRYGQNERTLFSFLTGSDPNALPAVLRTVEVEPDKRLPLIGLDILYDFFLSSARTSVSASSQASRWQEVELIIRDATGLKHDETEALKAIGVLNLIASAGPIRASKFLMESLLVDLEIAGSELEAQSLLDGLESTGLVTYREFADEYRIWRGSDFDIAGAVEAGRGQFENLPMSDLLLRSAELSDLIASRTSQQKGLLRVFKQRVVSSVAEIESEVSSLEKDYDGLCLLWLGGADLPQLQITTDRPVVIGQSRELGNVLDLALGVCAHEFAISLAKSKNADWVAIKEISERLSTIRVRLEESVSMAWSIDLADWFVLNAGSFQPLRTGKTLSGVLSDVCDSAYSKAPRIANEMIARRDLTSQGAKARRSLIEAIFENSREEDLGFSGFGPERAIYEAVLKSTGMHRRDSSGDWKFQEPIHAEWKVIWKSVLKSLKSVGHGRQQVSSIFAPILNAPFGLRLPLAVLIFIALLKAFEDDVALYEYGNFVLSVDDAVLERLAKNPDVFSVKYVGAAEGERAGLLEAYARRWQVPSTTPISYLTMARIILKEIRVAEPFSLSTLHGVSTSAIELRKAIRSAVEPDELLFEDLPRIAKSASNVPGKSKFDAADTANAVAILIQEIRGAYDNLLERIAADISKSFGAPIGIAKLRANLVERAVTLSGVQVSSARSAVLEAIGRDLLDDKRWLENLAMVMANGQPPRTWDDAQALAFPSLSKSSGSYFADLEMLSFDSRETAGEDPLGRLVVSLTNAQGLQFRSVSQLPRDLSPEVSTAIGNVVSSLALETTDMNAARVQLAAWLLDSVGRIDHNEVTEDVPNG